MSPALRAAIRACLRDVAVNFREPTASDVAEVMVRYDALAICGFRGSMEELRSYPDAERRVVDFITEEGLL